MENTTYHNIWVNAGKGWKEVVNEGQTILDNPEEDPRVTILSNTRYMIEEFLSAPSIYDNPTEQLFCGYNPELLDDDLNIQQIQTTFNPEKLNVNQSSFALASMLLHFGYIKYLFIQNNKIIFGVDPDRDEDFFSDIFQISTYSKNWSLSSYHYVVAFAIHEDFEYPTIGNVYAMSKFGDNPEDKDSDNFKELYVEEDDLPSYFGQLTENFSVLLYPKKISGNNYKVRVYSRKAKQISKPKSKSRTRCRFGKGCKRKNKCKYQH